MNELGVEAARELFRLIGGGTGSVQRLPGDIVVRHSCAMRT